MQSLLDFVLLIPCYNSYQEVLKSLNTIVYPFKKFEVLIVDDGSTIPIDLKQLQNKYPEMNIQLIRLPHNQGIVQALNTGLIQLKNRTDIKYIARLDAGDCCAEQRFYKQVNYLDEHKDIALLASWAYFENSETGSGYNYITKTKYEAILKEMHYKCSFIHPSVMFKQELLTTIGLYPTNYLHAEDYAFFWKILKKYKAAVLPEKLVTIVYSNKNISAVNYKKQLIARKQIVNNFGTNRLHQLLGSILLQLKSVLPISLILKLK